MIIFFTRHVFNEINVDFYLGLQLQHDCHKIRLHAYNFVADVLQWILFRRGILRQVTIIYGHQWRKKLVSHKFNEHRGIETNVTRWVLTLTINFYQQETGKLFPPYDVSTVARNAWESTGMARQLNWTVLITGEYIEPTICALQTSFPTDPRISPYKPEYKAIPSFALGYLQKISCSSYWCIYRTHNICLADLFSDRPSHITVQTRI